jgi:uncharacterized protein YcbK (DUF882 family)
MPTLVRPSLRRRDALAIGGAFGLSSFLVPAFAHALPTDAPRRAVLKNLHTGDAFNDVYFENGRYLPDALAEAAKVMRDWRTGETRVMDPGLYDTLHNINQALETRRPFQIISGYRSPKTNAMLHAKSSGVASNSQHTQGKAIDVRLEGVELSRLHKAALATQTGGVGYYPVSNFVHVDTARVRRWSGS